MTQERTQERTPERINALGFIEVRGLAAAIETADAMLKSADVRLLRQLLRDPVQTTLTVEGNLGACQAAVDAGRAAATRMSAFVTCHVIGRPAGDTADFVLSLAEAGRVPFGARPDVQAPAVAAETSIAAETTDEAALDQRLLGVLAGLPGGYGVQQIVRRVGSKAATVRHRLEALKAAGLLGKRGARYFLAEFDQASDKASDGERE